MRPLPQDCGKRFLPTIVDELSCSDPHRVIYSLARSADISEGFRDVSVREFADAVNKLTWWLVDQVGVSTKQEVLGYIGPHDLRHVLLTYASVKAGYQPLFLSSKNSTEGALAVLKAADCRVWIQAVEKPCEGEFVRRRRMRVLDMPELAELLDAQGTKHYPYARSWGRDAREVLCMLHTSGTTGLPKPVSWPHGLAGTMDASRLLPPVEGDGGMPPWTAGWHEGDRIYCAFPMSHAAGVMMDILAPALFGMNCVLGPPGVLPNISLLESLAEHGNIDVWSMVPSLVDELGGAPDVLDKFGRSKFICVSGGPVTKSEADKVNKVVRVLNLTGTTEGLFMGNLRVSREDWHWLAFHPYAGFEFREVGGGVYEHWVHRNQHWELFQGIFHTLADGDSVNLKDLYVRHPANPHLYAYHGRADDIIVLSSGYKIQPLETEAAVTAHAAVKGCLVVGRGRPQAALLIELHDAASSADGALLDSIWLAVQRADASSLHRDQLHRDFILFARPEKPFVRTDKGTVKRAATETLYEDDVACLYRGSPLSVVDDDIASGASVGHVVRHIVRSLAPQLRGVAEDADLFESGLDSLLVVRAIRAVCAATGLSSERLAPRHLYANPTVAKFAATVVGMTSGSMTDDGRESNAAETLNEMEHLLARYR